MKNKKAAKDLEFERERAKFRKQIRELEQENASLSLTLTERNVEIQKADEEIRSLKDWVQRLLEYTEMSEEEMRKRIENERAKDEILNTFGEFGQIFRRFGIL